MSCPPSNAALEPRPLPSTGITRLPQYYGASPPPRPARPVPRGRPVGACYATDGASRVALLSLFHTCHRHYPGAIGRCIHRSLPGQYQPSPIYRRVGLRIISFEACSAFTVVAARMVAKSPLATRFIGVLQTMSLPPPSAPIASGWSDSCRAGFAPARRGRLCTAHCRSETEHSESTRVYECRGVTRRGATRGTLRYHLPDKVSCRRMTFSLNH